MTVAGAMSNPDSIGLTAAPAGTPAALGIREVLPAGWGDTYGQYLPGQAIDITHAAPNGTYEIEVVTKPGEPPAGAQHGEQRVEAQGGAGGTRAPDRDRPTVHGIDTEAPVDGGGEGPRGWQFGR